MNDDNVLNLVVVGDSGVVKTSLVERFSSNHFTKNVVSTMGIDFKIKKLRLFNHKFVKVQVWDTAGQERFKTITNSYYRRAQGILIVFDVTNEDSFVNVDYWYKQIKYYVDVTKVPIVLIGNKIDCAEEDRVISHDAAMEKASKMGVEYYETSALNAVNVEESFINFSERAFNRMSASKKKVLELTETISSYPYCSC